MNNFDLKKYLAEGRLLKEDVSKDPSFVRTKEGLKQIFQQMLSGELSGKEANDQISDFTFGQGSMGIYPDTNSLFLRQFGMGGGDFNDYIIGKFENGGFTPATQPKNKTALKIWNYLSNLKLAEGRLLKEEVMVNPIIMFGGKKYIKDVISSPDDFGFDENDAEWVKNNILSSPKMVSIQDYMDLDDRWVKQAQIETDGGGNLDHIVDALKVHIKQGLITPEQEKEAMKVVGLTEGRLLKENLVDFEGNEQEKEAMKVVGLAEGRLFEEKMSLEVDDDFIELSADSGEYNGDLNDDGTVDFSVVYDDGTEFDDSTWKSILGKKHAFVKISNQIPTKVEAAGDYVMITVDLEDLKNLIKPNKSKNMKNLGSYETKDSKGNIVKRYI
jgi:hypothetical protein